MIRDILAQIGWRLLKWASQSLWDSFWSTFVWAIDKAEAVWEDKGRGEAKKEWVVDTVMDFAKQQISLNFFTRRALRVFVSRAVDAALKNLNEEIGKDWREHVEDLESYLADKIPFIDSIL